jgi:DNA-binding CsgD family transcriptional regulator
MTHPLEALRLQTAVEGIKEAPTTQAVLEIFNKALAEVGARYFGFHFLPRPEENVEEASIAWEIPAAFRELYVSEGFGPRDPALRYARRTILPFDFESAPYDPETEPHIKEVVDRSRDFKMHKQISIPVPSPRGMIGMVGIAGPDFDERDVHKPALHSLSLHAFYRLEGLVGVRARRKAGLTEREREILAWVAEGKTAWEIGCILSLSQRTIEWHIRQACQKLGATNRLQAVAMLGDTYGALRHDRSRHDD